MTRCFLGLGSNLGEREENLRRAVALLAAHDLFAMHKISSIYATAPLGYEAQADFLNIVLQGETTLAPEALLALCRAVERRLKRIRSRRWGPRTIDVDILLYGDLFLAQPALTIPHPRLAERLFVLVPLAEIAPDLCWQGHRIQERIAMLQEQRINFYRSW